MSAARRMAELRDTPTCHVCDRPLEADGDRLVCGRDSHVHVELRRDDACEVAS